MTCDPEALRGHSESLASPVPQKPPASQPRHTPAGCLEKPQNLWVEATLGLVGCGVLCSLPAPRTRTGPGSS